MCSRLNTPRLDAAELTCYLECLNFIFVGSSIDMWAEDIPSHWIQMVLDYCDRSANKYLFQSKNPSRILDFIAHPVFHHSVVCTTIETNRFYPEIMRNSPEIEERVRAMEKIANLGIDTYVTAEPLMQFDLDKMVEYIKRCKPPTSKYRTEYEQKSTVARANSKRSESTCNGIGKVYKGGDKEKCRNMV